MKAQVKRGWKPSVIKKSLARQRSDVTLSKEITSALVRLVLSGQTLFPLSGRVEMMLPSEGGYKVYILSTSTINSWVKRGNIIPETGETLRDVLDKARGDYRTKKNEDRRKIMSMELEAQFHRTLRLRTNLPIRDVFGKVVTREDGSIVRKENVDLLRLKMDNVKFLAERLIPEVYGKKVKAESKPLAFSLSDLRRAREERDAQKVNGLS